LLIGAVLSCIWNRRNAALNDLTLTCLHLSLNDRVLDVGCGGGYLIEQMAQVTSKGMLTGVDVSPAVLAYCRRRLIHLMHSGRLKLNCASAESLPFKSSTFTHTCTVNTIFYFNDPAGALAEFWRVLTVGGRAAVTFTWPEDLENRPFSTHELNLFSAPEVNALMENANFCNLQFYDGADRHRRFYCIVGQKQ
jgi:ubiquinone/menaquinone biosynthesis C-methylase UbiE